MLFHGADILIIALLALLIDRRFGEFSFIRHPVVIMGDVIKAFERHFYRDSIGRGALLTLCLVTFSLLVGLGLEYGVQYGLGYGQGYGFEYGQTNDLQNGVQDEQNSPFLSNLPGLIVLFVSLLLSALFASTLLAHRMLHDSVLSLLHTDHPQQPLQWLVSRDTAQLSDSDCYKAGIETYAENLSDGVIAPLFYLLLFGLPGILVYKAINTLDSMVGYRTERYERFGKVSAKVDDWVNFIPARLTAILLRVLNKTVRFWDFHPQGRLHDSPNAGHPITAMALNINVQLGGDTVYFGVLKSKPYFGRAHAPKQITPEHLTRCLAYRNRVDGLLYLMLSLLIIYTFNDTITSLFTAVGNLF
ncbi:MAG: cobalamin biosynthesis protein CobD [Gammaproteobacteria bacterium]|nr:cobalamin biosynthesis protein CobD [Gammaproteobacteria bacterium]